MGFIAGTSLAIGTAIGLEGAAATMVGGALLGAGMGAAGSAITGGDPLKGALMGGVMGGVGGAFGGPAEGAGTSALGDGTALGGNLGGSGFAGAGLDAYSSSAAAMGYGPSAASSLDAASSGLSGVGSLSNVGLGTQPTYGYATGATDGLTTGLNSAESSNFLSPVNQSNYAAANNAATQNAATAADTAASQVGPDLGKISSTNPLTSSYLNQTAGPISGSSASTSSGIGGTADNLGSLAKTAVNKKAADEGILGLGISKGDLIKGVLGMGSNLLGGTPKQYSGPMPGPASTAATQGPYFNQSLQPYTYNAPPRTQVTPAPTGPLNTNPSGVMPTYFAGNSLANYGFGAHARGGPIHGALSMAHGGHEAPAEGRVRGPGSGISDDVPAMLSNDEYVLTARDVSTIGGGSSEEGARRLDAFRQQLHRTANKKQFLDKRTEGALDNFSNSIGGRRHG